MKIWLLSAALALSMVAVFSQGAEARLHGGIANGAAPTTPALTNTTVTLGQQTQAFFGYVRLDSQDFTSPSYIPFTISGLGLMSPTGPACDTWYVTFISGRSSGDFLITSPVANASGITPNVSGTGAGNLTGDYIYQYQCSRAGVFSNTATLTIHTVPNAANIGGQDNFASGWAPNNFGSTPGAKLLLSTGADFHGEWVRLAGVTLGSTAPNHLTITIADSGRYPYVSDFETTGLSYVDTVDVVATGNTDIDGVGALFGVVGPFTSTDNTLSNVRYYGSYNSYPSTQLNSGQDAFDLSFCTSNCVMQNLVADFIESGFNISDALHASNIDIGHYANNCSGIASGSVGATVDNFTTCHDGILSVQGLHTDCIQGLDGATVYKVHINNFWCIAAGAGGDAQGPIFGGGQIGSLNNVAMGYIDDGTGAHGAGTKLTLTAGTLYSSSFNSQIWSPGHITIAQNVRVLANNTGTGTPIATSGLSATNIGSPGSPVAISNVGAFQLQMEGVINTNTTFNGFASNGESDTSFLRHFGYVQQVPNPLPQNSFTGTVNGAVSPYPSGLTISVTSDIVSNYPNIMQPYAGPASLLTYSGCTTCSGATPTSIGGEYKSTEPVQASANATFSGTTMTVSAPCTGRFDYGVPSSQLGGLMISGGSVPDQTYIIPQLFLPADGCAGTYTLSQNVGTIGSTAVVGRPRMGRGLYGLYGTTAVPGGPYAMATNDFFVVPAGQGASVSQVESGGSPYCTSSLHQGTFSVDHGYAQGGISLCGAPVTNTTASNNASPVAADFNTGALPYTTLNAITETTWRTMTTAQERAAVCAAMLPKSGGALDLGGGNWVGPFTGTGELILAGGNVAVTGCGIH